MRATSSIERRGEFERRSAAKEQEMTTHHFSTPGTVHLRVDNAAGSVTIATHDEPSTDVELSFEGPGDDETFLDQARVEANPTDDGYEVIVEIPRRHGGFGGMLRWLVMNH